MVVAAGYMQRSCTVDGQIRFGIKAGIRFVFSGIQGIGLAVCERIDGIFGQQDENLFRLFNQKSRSVRTSYTDIVQYQLDLLLLRADQQLSG